MPQSQLTLTSQTTIPQTTDTSVLVTTSDGYLISSSAGVIDTDSPSFSPAPNNQLSLTVPQDQTSILTDSYGWVTGTSTVSVQIVGAPPPGSELELSGKFTEIDYFLALYLPKLIAVFVQSM
jgi:hypothetical protein